MPLVQYIGFQVKPSEREYSFNVREAGVDRTFTLNIPNEAFISHRARYQDAPAICALRLNAELAAHSNNPPEARFMIASIELDSFRESHSPAVSRKSSARRHREDF